jgi:hypothetical protein
MKGDSVENNPPFNNIPSTGLCGCTDAVNALFHISTTPTTITTIMSYIFI